MASKRDEILKSALNLFAKKGFDGVGLREIAADANVAQPTINYHFDSKDLLLQAVVEKGARRTTGFRKDELAQIMARTPEMQLEDIVRILFQPYNQLDQATEEELTFIQFVGKLGALENVVSKRMIMEAYDEMAMHFITAMTQTPERMDRETAAKAYMYALPTGMFAITHAHRIPKMIPGAGDDAGAPFDYEDVVTFICAGMRAMKK